MPKDIKSTQTSSTQESLLISEIKDGFVVLRDGTLRAVVLARPVNFDLMSTQEQNSAEYAFQGFLNSLHFPVQISIKSQRIDLDGYIEKLEKKLSGQDNELLAALMEDYIGNIKALVEEVNIMDKSFYVVVPFFPPLLAKTGFKDNLKHILKPQEGVVTLGAEDFERFKAELGQRVELVTSGLNQMGVRAIPLNTQELIDLYYSSYNPDVAANQKLIDAGQLQSASVTRKGEPVTAPVAVPAPQLEPQTAVGPAPAVQPQAPVAPPPSAPAAPVAAAPAAPATPEPNNIYGQGGSGNVPPGGTA